MQLTTSRIDEILSETQIVAGAIERHGREARDEGRLAEEAAMHRLHDGVVVESLSLTSPKSGVVA